MVNDRIEQVMLHYSLNKNSFSKRIGLTNNVTIGNIVGGRRSKPSYDVLTKIMETFPEVNPHWLMTGEGEMISKYDLKTTVHESKQAYITNKNGNVFKQLPDGSFDVEVPVIPFRAHASYIESLETATVQEDFETTVFKVDQVGLGNYRAFVVRGDSMNGGGIDDTKDGATVLGRELGKHHWRDGFHPTLYGWVILCKQNIFHKDITAFDPETGKITCHSRNTSPEFSDFEISLNDVYQIFKVIKRIF